MLEFTQWHRNTEQAGRTLLARALPTTFGRLVDTWLAGLAEARSALDRVRHESLAVQLGGAVGTLDDPPLTAAFAAELGLLVPVSCWHTNRIRIAELAAALGMVTGALGKIAGDVVLLAQAEIGELIVELRSATAGAGSFTRQFDRMAEVTGRTADQIIAAHRVAA